jgi:hypothetical protein
MTPGLWSKVIAAKETKGGVAPVVRIRDYTPWESTHEQFTKGV